jgi:[NiFe] hydrogenase diaphorase moiety small subunit
MNAQTPNDAPKKAPKKAPKRTPKTTPQSPPKDSFVLDGAEIPFAPGQTLIEAALDADVYIPHLCYHPEFAPHGSCRLCAVKLNGRIVASCTTPCEAGAQVESNTDELNAKRRMVVQMLFVEGNHFCPACEKSGNCKLQAVAYDLEMYSAQFDYFFPRRPVDASHPDILLDFNRCILCELCIRASSEVDGKNCFSLSGRGIDKHLIVNAESGRLADTDMAVTDKAMQVCPVGVILKKRVGFAVPIGQRRFDLAPMSAQALADAPPLPTPRSEGEP